MRLLKSPLRGATRGEIPLGSPVAAAPAGAAHIHLTGVATLRASLDHTGRRVVLVHTLNTLRRTITKKSHRVLSKFTVWGWAAFTAILGHVRPTGHSVGWTP